MKIILSDLVGLTLDNDDANTSQIQKVLNACIEDYADDFVQDMSHISQAANYSGNIKVDEIVHLKDNLYRCDYSYDWAIAWTCSGVQEGGRVKEKVRFTLEPSGELQFKFLKLDA
ncbi:hypothetical protein [Thiomicrorhabdus sp. Milos-T2]|uniref:hypothetical protein n=1 Tax=Thiomicrorhabdus sp. Milos-T2 TaxID=90814 RepID=UPI000494251A|nr:hypothetical protein [Thiomicrorhabdus sp. Milos-T2]